MEQSLIHQNFPSRSTTTDTNQFVSRTGLFVLPENEFSLENITVHYNIKVSYADYTVVGGNISSTIYSRPDELNFHNTLEKHGIPGVSYCPYTKIIIPSYKDVKVNKLKLKFDTDLKYKFTGVLNDGNYYTDEGDTILNEIKLFKNTHYVITFDTTIDTNKKQIKFASSIPSSGDYHDPQIMRNSYFL